MLCLVNYIPKPIRKSIYGFKDKIVNLFKANTPKQTLYGRGKKLCEPIKQNIFDVRKEQRKN